MQKRIEWGKKASFKRYQSFFEQTFRIGCISCLQKTTFNDLKIFYNLCIYIMCTLFNEYMQEVIKYWLYAATLNLIFATDHKFPFMYTVFACFTSDTVILHQDHAARK
jgi:hypothetical protein